MTKKEFDLLDVGMMVYSFNSATLGYISTFSAAITKHVIDEKVNMRDGVIGFHCNDGGIITLKHRKYWFLTERDALSYKIIYMKEHINSGIQAYRLPSIRAKAEIAQGKFNIVMNSKRVRRLLLDSHPELFV
jgi:hypothetical protein